MKINFKLFFLFISFCLSIFSASAAVISQNFVYKIGKNDFEGFIAYDDSVVGKRPTVMIVHEWMGLGEYEMMRAKEIAEMGYLAFAVDIYGKGVRAKDVKEAQKLATLYKSNRKEMRARAKGALDAISKHPSFDAEQVGSMGYCFGGTVSLEMARAGFPLRGAVSFHGGLETSMPAKKGESRGRVLVLHGADDPYVPEKEVGAFEAEMRSSGLDWELVKFGGAVHGFSKKAAGENAASGYAYDQKADQRSYELMRNFWRENFGR